ncbi:coproporphyrinogen III oxidase [Methanobrevibacter cuticularis]|uniref:tRNA carboxymethyluridine synthase n=1 Tax=Methanobrevibacter cuticularis TaxID=47311 RepID=A0A166F6R5_9EURY|nr:tRNA uridine(34) 5-carboxymethylaminomethyl modification radical SAM/GNAT enzyme Elp3 [Methanobrevibacter cuticularis]KZX17372.1 coproporphyrinogen III oxidase [Methanobrevibacter cuticularis]
MEKACRLIIDDIIDKKIKSRHELEKAKRQICRDFNLLKFMSNSDILKYTSSDERDIVANIVRKKPTRTISGVAIVAVMCHPHKCPHGRCFYCPESELAPPSYTGEEPAALRARMFNFDPYTQCYNRLNQLNAVGHPVDKVELIIMGGTFPSRELSYQQWFISQCIKAMIDFGLNLEDINTGAKLENVNTGLNLENVNTKLNLKNVNTGLNLENVNTRLNLKNVNTGLNLENVNTRVNLEDISINSNPKNNDSKLNNSITNNPKTRKTNTNSELSKITNKKDIDTKISKNLLKIYPPNDYVLLEDVQRVNENSKIRCIGMTFETRPDYCKIEDVDRMLNMGVTRVELGVQTTYDFIYKRMERGHTVHDVINANKILRDSGIKVAMHLIPGLINNPDMDLRMFKRVFRDESFKPDMLKIYPCLVTKGSKLYDLWKEGKYKPYEDEEAIDLIVKIKKILPKWVRTMRIQRDIPTPLIEAGVQKSNLGELVYNKLDKEGVKCQCIRCREIGHKINKSEDISKINVDDFKLFKEKYSATKGKEIFLSFEDEMEETLAGFLRLRLPSKEAHRKEVDEKTAIVRELHVYGKMIKIGSKGKSAGQHAGFGEKLLSNAEEIAIKNNKDKLLIISGIGARNYYRKFGYEREGPYMAKKLN